MKFREGMKLRCVDNCGFNYWIKGKVYVVDGRHRIYDEDGAPRSSGWFYREDKKILRGDIVFEEVKDMFGKKDLKSGMVVEFRNGNKYLFVGSVPHYNEKNNSTYMIGINDKWSFMNLSNHDESMKSVSANREWDVVKVYNLSDQCDMSVIMMNADLIWQRQEKSPAEIELEEAEKDMERAIERVKNAKAKIEEEK